MGLLASFSSTRESLMGARRGSLAVQCSASIVQCKGTKLMLELHLPLANEVESISTHAVLFLAKSREVQNSGVLA